jgi:RND family efflux transporter MFP subunit
MASRDQEATISAPVAGILDSLPVKFGQAVTKGQMIAHLSTQTLKGQIAQAHASIGQYTVQVQQAEANALQQQGQTKTGMLQARSAIANGAATLAGARATLVGAQATLTSNEAALNNAQKTLERTKGLFTEGLVAQKDVEAAELVARSAEAQVVTQKQIIAAQEQTVAAQEQTVIGLRDAEQAAALARYQDTVKQKDIQVARQQLANAVGTLQTTQSQLALYTIYAPLTGTITNINGSVGETVDPTVKFLTITNLDRLQLQMAIPTNTAGVVHAGQMVVFRTDSLPNHSFRSMIRTIGTQVDPNTSTITAIADVNNPGHLLKDDLNVRVGLVVGRHDHAILVPRAAVLYDAGSSGNTAHVMKLDKDNVLHSVSVTVGYANDSTVEILEGVKPGERLATTGAYGLPDGTKVQIEGEKSEAPSKDSPKESAGDEKGKAS